MNKFTVTIYQRAYRRGTYEIEAPDQEAAYTLAEDISFFDPRIKYEEGWVESDGYPEPEDMSVERATAG